MLFPDNVLWRCEVRPLCLCSAETLRRVYENVCVYGIYWRQLVRDNVNGFPVGTIISLALSGERTTVSESNDTHNVVRSRFAAYWSSESRSVREWGVFHLCVTQMRAHSSPHIASPMRYDINRRYRFSMTAQRISCLLYRQQ